MYHDSENAEAHRKRLEVDVGATDFLKVAA